MTPFTPPSDGSYAPHPIESPGGVERRAAPRTRYVHGDQRTAGWLAGPIERELCCPRGHHIRDGALIVGEQPVRCQHRDVAGRAPCGLLVWVIVDTRSSAVYVAEVDWADVRAIKEHRDVQETLRYLGAPMWPRMTIDRSA
ncbi:hypothetical protein [Roseisolibacter agri]|uniref:Uncharacterized protein n=1 Tax=Roseisolibacter agri TaxID=2014610 RepID=A0AA37Q8N3_9BACT|nr:hypothetical protein [Roseisolibacter agri]GLC25081.1 hypothetical protein rosag_15940 [Roseisolibacter agri]